VSELPEKFTLKLGISSASMTSNLSPTPQGELDHELRHTTHLNG